MPVQKGTNANEELKEGRRRLIFFSAMKVFTKKGYTATKISDIAAEAGISYGLLYYYFRSKDDLYSKLLDYAATSFVKMLEKIDRQDLEPPEKIHKIFLRIFNGLKRKDASAYYYVLYVQALLCDVGPSVAKEAVDRIRKPLYLLCGIIAEGQKRKQLRPGDPMEMAVSAFSMILGLSSLIISGKLQHLPDSSFLFRIFE